MEDGYIDELEIHLRDEIENLLSKGSSESSAFEEAKNKIGSIESVSIDYYKSFSEQRKTSPVEKKFHFPGILYFNT